MAKENTKMRNKSKNCEAKNTGKPYLQDLNAATRDTTTDFHGRRRKFLYLAEDNNRAKAVTKIDNHDYVRGR